MKLSVLRHSLLLALVVGLSACGGKATFPVEGKIENLKYSGLVLSNVGMQNLAVDANATSFRFPNTIEYGVPYDVKVVTSALHQSCNLAPLDSGKDTAGRQASINVFIRCIDNAFSIGGAVKVIGADGKVLPYTGDGLVLINGSNDRYSMPKDATAYKFARAIPYGTSYGVSVLTQPDGGKYVCTVERGVGIMGTGEKGDADVTNIDVTCREK
ncbi:hypothetical protein [Massilia pseudoviolaceinigra]|uniref:hypothetical protein n=1 Tax=Massilia pseudoviolaceinigra TaxID=3057165 RepID=UPI0027967197|nr:hypothetical protein [Massilia sp. CCM 9206]MDQ1923916.1 hypothetical protein [Massilia sp. CCM 9206]